MTCAADSHQGAMLALLWQYKGMALLMPNRHNGNRQNTKKPSKAANRQHDFPSPAHRTLIS